METDHDVLHRFQLERAGVRGAIVRLEQSWQDICAHSDYAEPVQRLLGQTVAASALFTSVIKFEGRLSIHLRDEGPLQLLFAECSHDGRVRGIARWEGASPQTPITLGNADARLAITIENAVTDTRYQGLVPVEGDTMAAAFEGYFERSEQLPTRILLAARAGRCAGIMLQRMPGEGGIATTVDADAWNRVTHLLATLSDDELLELPIDILLLRLFHEESVRLQPAQTIGFECTCSRERVASMLRSLGEEEGEATLAEQGSIEVTCEFCNRQYSFDRVDVAAVFALSPLEQASTTPQ